MRRGVAYGVMAGAFWGSVFIAPRLLPGFSPLALSAGRYTTYGLVSLLVGLPLFRQLAGKLTRQDCLALFSLSLSGNIVYYILLAAAVQRVGIAPTSLTARSGGTVIGSSKTPDSKRLTLATSRACSAGRRFL